MTVAYAVAQSPLDLLLGAVGRAGARTLFDVGSTFSLWSVAGGIVLAAIAIGVARLRRGRPLTPRYLVRALAPRAATLAASGRTDAGFFLFNTFCASSLIGWALLTQSQVARWTGDWLTAAAGPSHAAASGPWPAALYSVVIFLAYELAYWVDHWLSHNVPALWELHKVHHTAEALSPLTNFRVHPLDSLVFYNLVALFTGVAAGALNFGLGPAHGRLTLLGADALVVAFGFTFAHLLHTHVWLRLPEPWSRLVMSPAAHQIHHSVDPAHYGRNLGNALAVWDWLFGTLHLPAPERERLSFGVPGEDASAHTIRGTLIRPVMKAAAALRGQGG